MGIKQARKAVGMTATRLAEIMGVSRISVYQWERGEALPRSRKLLLLSETLKVPVDDLLKGNGNAQRLDTEERPIQGTD